MVEFSGIFGDKGIMKQLFKIFLCVGCTVFIFHSNIRAADSNSDELVVRFEDRISIYHLADLKGKLKTQKMTVPANPAYKNRKMEYEGFDLQEFVSVVAPDKKSASLTAICLDGFQTTISPEMFTKGRKALLAFQQVSTDKNDLITADKKWSLVELKGSWVSPGPYYIVWNSPEGTYPMGWPFQIREIRIGPTYEPYPLKKK